jgi:hypothetical protein
MANTTRRQLIRQSLLGAGAFVAARSLAAFGSPGSGIEISLAEWSLHRSLYDGKLDHLEFPAKAKKEFGISAVEYVNGFFGGRKMDFKKAAKSSAYLKELLERSKDAGVVNHLLMVATRSPKRNASARQRRSWRSTCSGRHSLSGLNFLLRLMERPEIMKTPSPR